MRFTCRQIDPLPDPLRRSPDLVWMSSETSLWGWGEAVRLQPGTGPDRFEMARLGYLKAMAGSQFESETDIPGTGPVAFASLTYAMGSAGSILIVPEVVVTRRANEWFLTIAEGRQLPPPVDEPRLTRDRARYAGSSVPDVLWLEAVAKAVGEIEAGALQKVVLARDYAVWSRQPFHPPRLLRHLASRFPGCHTFSVAGLIGSSPELLVRRMGSRFESVVLAGTAPVFQDPAEDARAGADLMGSQKDRWEHQLAVDSVRSALEPHTDNLVIPDQPRLLRLDNLQHLASSVSADIIDELDALGLAERLHPTAAVGGTPTETADALIGEIEGMDRGRYAGPVGWMDAKGDGEFAIALRSAEMSGARARLFAGAGIVAGSLPEAELEETRIKLTTMMGALEA